MKFEEARDVFFSSEKIRPVLAGMGERTREEFFNSFFHYPTPMSFDRVDGSKINLTVRVYLDLQDSNKDGKENLVALFFIWKKRFDGFEKKVLDVLANDAIISKPFLGDYALSDRYRFLRSASFLEKKGSWEKKGVDKCKDEIKESYYAYSKRDRDARCLRELREYYVVDDGFGWKILANKFTHQLYHLIKTMEGTNGEGFSWVPLMVKYEDVYEIFIEECEIWDGNL